MNLQRAASWYTLSGERCARAWFFYQLVMILVLKSHWPYPETRTDRGIVTGFQLIMTMNHLFNQYPLPHTLRTPWLPLPPTHSHRPRLRTQELFFYS